MFRHNLILFFSFVYVLSLTNHIVYAQSGDDAKNLLTALFTTNAYNKKVRPLADQTRAVEIYTEFTLNSKYHLICGHNCLREVANRHRE